MMLSCGVLLLSEHDEIFLAHATGSDYWDLPKGGADPGESPLDAAVRETREETGVRVPPRSLLDLGEFDYLPGRKRLHLFALKVPRDAVDLAQCRCTSFFWDRRTRRRLPETDAFAWVRFAQIPRHCGKSMTALLTSRMDLTALARRLPLQEAAALGGIP